MTVFFKQARRRLRTPLKEAAKTIKTYLLDPELIERMKLFVAFWKVGGLKEESVGYHGRYSIGFGVPVRIGVRANDEAHFIFRVEVNELKKAKNDFDHELLLSFVAYRRDLFWNNYPVRVPLAAALTFERILKPLARINYKELLNKACRSLFEEDFLRLTEGLPPRT